MMEMTQAAAKTTRHHQHKTHIVCRQWRGGPEKIIQ
jgi:hypothetical protein